MNLSTHDIGLESLDALTGYDSLCIFVAEDERPLQATAGYVDWRMCGALSAVLVEKFFTGAEAETLLLPTHGRFPASRIFVIGLGKVGKLDAEVLGRLLSHAARTLARAGAQSVVVELPGEGRLDDGVRAGALKAQFLPPLGKAKVAVLGGKTLGRLLAG